MDKKVHKVCLSLGLLALSVSATSGTAAFADEKPIALLTQSSNEINEKVRLSNGALIRTANNSGVFVIQNNQKKPIPSPITLESYSYSFDDVKLIPESDFNSIPNGKVLPLSSGSVVRVIGQQRVYLIEEGKRRYIPSPDVFFEAGYSEESILEISQDQLEDHPRGKEYTDPSYIPNGDFVYTSERNGVFKVENDTLRPVPSVNVLLTYLGDFDRVRKVREDQINAIPEGDLLLPADRTVIQEGGVYYLVDSGYIRAFDSRSHVSNEGFRVDEVITVADTVINRLTKGPDLSEEWPENSDQNQLTTIADLLGNTEQLTTLQTAVDAADLTGTLSDEEGEFTVFAPTNQAFNNLPEGTLDTLLQEENKGDLASLLQYHVLDSKVLSGDLGPEQTVTTLEGTKLTVKASNGNVTITDEQRTTYSVQTADVEASNGVVHIIDGVLMQAEEQPTIEGLLEDTGNLSTLRDAVDAADLTGTLSDEEGEFTVFAPTNQAFNNLPEGTLDTLLQEENKGDLASLLQYHVLDSKVLSGDLGPEQTVTTLEGTELTVKASNGNVTITDEQGTTYSVQTADVEASNGVVHIIDGVLMQAEEQPTIEGLLEDTGNLSTLRDAVDAADLTGTLSDEEGEFTVFAPTNQAFNNLPEGTLDTLLQEENKGDLASLLQYHVLDSKVLSEDLGPEQTVTTLEGTELTVKASNGNVTITDEQGTTYSVQTADVEASNGVVHIIDGVLQTAL